MYFKYLLIGIVPLIITHNLTSSIKNSYLLWYFILNCIINIIVINFIYIVIFFRTSEFKYYLQLFNKLRKKINLLNL